MRIILYIYLVILGAGQLSAQTTFQPKPLTESRKGIVYNKELTFDFTAHTNGYAFGVSWGKIATYYKTNYYYAGFGEIKHPKEYRQNFKYINTLTGEASNSFVYGKQNNFFLLRAGKGFKRYYTEKAKEKGVAVGISFEAGATLGLLKPYYLELTRFQDQSRPRLSSERYSEENKDVFLDITRIFGSSGLLKGVGQMSFVPGIHARLGTHFEWGAYEEFIKALEVGVMVDVFTRSIPLMVNQQNRPFFVNLYITLQLGKRT
jgi:hypothetical protein